MNVKMTAFTYGNCGVVALYALDKMGERIEPPICYAVVQLQPFNFLYRFETFEEACAAAIIKEKTDKSKEEMSNSQSTSHGSTFRKN